MRTNPIALITGASSGLGLEFAKLFARESHDLALVARSHDKLKNIADGLKTGLRKVVDFVDRNARKAVAAAVADPKTRYSLGSVLTHVLMHQTVIGEEALLQMAMVGETPDLLVGCTGGGSNFGGLAFPFLREKMAGRMNPTIRCVEPAACPSLTKGEYRYDFGDTAGMTPLLKMHTLGHDFIPPSIHAGGLRYHGMSPLVSHIHELGLAEAEAIPQTECFAGALTFARSEGILPAPEPTHAIAAAIREAKRCKETGEAKVILTALCGHGHLDLAAYENYLTGKMEDYDLTDKELADAMSTVPVMA